MLGRFLGWDKPVPKCVMKENLRLFLLARYFFPVSAFIHFIFVFVFYLLGAPLLAAYNILSTVIWIAASALNDRGKHFLGLIIGGLELYGFCTLAVFTLGREAGFQFYLFCAMVMPFLLPRQYGRLFKLSMVINSVALFVVLVLVGQLPSLRVEVDRWMMWAILISNVVCEGTILALLGYYFSNAVHIAEEERDREHQKAKRLLYNVLPRSIADQLTDEFQTIAQSYDEVSVLFCDLVGFTTLADKTPPDELVDLLNVVFSRFDDIADRYGLEKIKTIGDAYMVVAGVPDPVSDHAEALADFALDITREIQAINRAHGRDLDLRVGINTGSVVAGIIGKRKFAFDLWGDCVNTASRMESHGEPGRIQITQATYELLKDRYETESRGVIDVKGKGSLATHFLVARKGDTPSQKTTAA